MPNIHTAPAAVNSPAPDYSTPTENIPTQLRNYFAYLFNVSTTAHGADPYIQPTRQHLAERFKCSIRTMTRSLDTLAEAGYYSRHQPPPTNGYWQPNQYRPGPLGLRDIRNKGYELLGRAGEVFRTVRKTFERGTRMSYIALKEKIKKKKAQKKLKVEGSKQIPLPLFEPSTDISKEIVAKIATFQAKHFPPQPQAP